MTVPKVPMTIDELERMRQILRKADTEHLPLTNEEEAELRGYVAREKPEDAKTADIGYLIFIGLALLGLYFSLLLVDKQIKSANTAA